MGGNRIENLNSLLDSLFINLLNGDLAAFEAGFARLQKMVENPDSVDDLASVFKKVEELEKMVKKKRASLLKSIEAKEKVKSYKF